MKRLFWIIAASLAAIAVHAGLIVFFPGYSFGRDISRLSREPGSNRFFILDQPQQEQLFPAFPHDSVVGVCAFDVEETPVVLSARMPKGFWTLTVYSARGNVIYSVNDRQAGTDSFTVGLLKARDFLETLLHLAEKEAIEEDTGWTVKTVEPRGLAVLWYPVTEEAARPAIISRMSQSQCGPAQSPG